LEAIAGTISKALIKPAWSKTPWTGTRAALWCISWVDSRRIFKILSDFKEICTPARLTQINTNTIWAKVESIAKDSFALSLAEAE
jgi:hypothetical protein